MWILKIALNCCSILSAINVKLSNLSSVIYSRKGINVMWILENGSELLQKMNSFHYPKITSMETFEAEGRDTHVGKSNISV